MTRHPIITNLGFTCFRLIALAPGEVPWAPVRLRQPTRRMGAFAAR